MKKKIELPEAEILETYKGIWWTPKKLAKKYETTEYRITKLLKEKGVLRKSSGMEKFLIEKLLKYERRFDPKKVGAEMFMAKRLLQDYPDDEFWKAFKLGFELNSLAYLQSVDGKALLKKKYAEFGFELSKQEEHNVGEKVGEDVEIISRPMSIHEFLKR